MFRRWTILLLVMMLALAACGGGDDGGDDEGDDADTGDTATEVADAGDTTDEDDSEGTGSTEALVIELANGGSFTITPPEGWLGEVNEDEGVVALANSQDALAVEDVAVLEEGQVRGTVDFLPDESEALEALDATRRTRPQDLVATLGETFSEEQGAEFANEPNLLRTLLISGAQGAMGTGSVELGDDPTAFTIMVIRRDGGFGRIVFYAPEGEIGTQEGTLRNIIASIEYEEPAEGAAPEESADATEEAAATEEG